MNDNIRSPFQMRAYRTRRFLFSTPFTPPSEEDKIHGEFSGDYLVDRRDDKWCGFLIMSYSVKNDASNDEEQFSFEITMDGVFEYTGDDSEKEKAQFVKFLKVNGAVALLSIMRGQVAAATNALGLSPGLIVPSINLNNFQWNDLSSDKDDE